MGHELAQHVDVTRDGDIVTVTLNWPEKRNALAARRDARAHRALREVGKSDATGVILAANGPVFSAGHDFGDMKDARSPTPVSCSTCARR